MTVNVVNVSFILHSSFSYTANNSNTHASSFQSYNIVGRNFEINVPVELSRAISRGQIESLEKNAAPTEYLTKNFKHCSF